MKKDGCNNWVAWLALGLSAISLLLWLCRYEPVTWTLLDASAGLLSLLVTFLIGWQIYNTVSFKKVVSDEIDKNLRDFENKSLQAIINAQYTAILREAALDKEDQGDNGVLRKLSDAIYFASLVKDKDKLNYCIGMVNNILNRHCGEKMNSVYCEAIKEALYPCVNYCSGAKELIGRLDSFM